MFISEIEKSHIYIRNRKKPYIVHIIPAVLPMKSFMATFYGTVYFVGQEKCVVLKVLFCSLVIYCAFQLVDSPFCKFNIIVD